MDPRQCTGQVSIALVGNQNIGPTFSNKKICPGNANIGIEKLVPQYRPRLIDKRLGLSLSLGFSILPVMLVEQFGDLLAGFVRRRSNNVTGVFFGQLDNVLTQVCLNHLQPCALK